MSTIAKLVIFLSAGIICITPTELSAQDYFDRLSKKDVVTYDAVQRRSYKIECLTSNFDFIICIALQKPDHIFSKAINLLDNTTAPLPYDKKEIADLVMSNIKSVQEN